MDHSRYSYSREREREFRAGRFFQPSEVPPGFIGRLLGRAPSKPKPPASIREAIKLAGATGTRSILDMERVGRHFDYGLVASLPPEELRRLFGTDQPTKKDVEASEALVEELDRGQGIAVVTYEHGKPKELRHGNPLTGRSGRILSKPTDGGLRNIR